MITEKGKEYIARNFGVNNCYALEEVVPCTVYTEGTPNERVLDTSTILFVLVTEVAERVKTAAGTFTLANLIAANSGSYISMMDALGIEAYCIPGAPPVAPPTAPPVTPPPIAKITKAEIITEIGKRGAIDTSAISATPGKYKWYMYLGRLHYDTLNFEKGISIRNLATRNPPRQTADLSLTENKTSVNELDRSWVLARLGELPYAGVEPPVTPPVTPPIAPVAPKRDYEIVNPSVNCDSKKCYARFDLKNNIRSASLYMRLEVDGAVRYKRYSYILRGWTKPQVLSTSITDLSAGYHNLSIVVGKVTDTDTYTHRFFVAGPGIEPPGPAVAKITPAEIIAEIKGRGAIDTAGISTTVGKNYWYIVHGEWGSGPWVNYVATNFIKAITLAIAPRNPPTLASDITLKENHNVVNELDRNWVLTRLAELPFVGAPPVTPPIGVPGVTIAVDKTTCRINQQIRLTGTYTSEDGRLLVGHDIGFSGYLKGTKKYLGKTKTTSGGRYGFTYTPTEDGTWQFTAYDDYTSPKVTVTVTPPVPVTPPYTPPVTPPYTPPVTPPTTPTEPPEAIKAWIVANYGDGTRVTTDGWRKLNVAKMANALAALPSGYTKASITEGVVLWAKANPNWETQTICGWINSIGVTNLTEDHGLYVYNLAIGWTTLANSIYATLSPKPSKPPSAIVTEDNGLGVYDYAIGWNTIANTITGCNF